MPVKFVNGDTGESSKGNTSAVVNRVEALADRIKNLDVNSKNLDTEIKEINSEVVHLFFLYNTLKKEGITGKGVEEFGKSLESLNKTIEETAKKLGREVEEVHTESLGPNIWQYLKASEGSLDEAAALTELYKNYLTHHTKNGMPQHYDVYELDKFGEKAAALKKILLGYGDLSLSLDYFANQSGNTGTSGSSDGAINPNIIVRNPYNANKQEIAITNKPKESVGQQAFNQQQPLKEKHNEGFYSDLGKAGKNVGFAGGVLYVIGSVLAMGVMSSSLPMVVMYISMSLICLLYTSPSPRD